MPNRAHGMLGVKADMAVRIFEPGPAFPSILLAGMWKYGLPSAIAPHAAITRLNRAGYTVRLVGSPPKLLPAAHTTTTPAS